MSSSGKLDSGTPGRILRFRPRNSAQPSPLPPPSPVGDLTKFEHVDEPDDFRHRMKMNGLAVVATVVLILAGVWIANTMAQVRKSQDCLMMGRGSCTQIAVPVQPR